MPLKVTSFLLCLLSCALLAGCTSIVGATSDEPIEIDPGKRTLGVRIDDSQIETIATVNIKKAHEQLDDAAFEVHSYNAVVLLVGQVPSQEMRTLAGKTVQKLSTVRQVHNELLVHSPISLLDSVNDSWLTTKIRTKLLASRDIESSRIKVVTENNTVYLMGLVTREEAQQVTDIARHTGGVQKVVRVFEYID